MTEEKKQKIDSITGKSNLWEGKHIYFDDMGNRYINVPYKQKNIGFGCSKFWIGEHIHFT